MGVTTSSAECAVCSCKRGSESTRANDVEDDPEVSADISCKQPLKQQSLALQGDLDAELTEAAKRSDAEQVQSLLLKKASVETQDRQSGWTLLHIAASEGCLALVPVLLQSRASPNRKDSEGRTPLLVAAERQHGEFAVLLAEALRPKEREALGKRLVEVSERGQLEESKILLKCSAPADARDREHKSALHFAAAGGHGQLARLLLDSGARRDAKTKIGCTPLGEAARAGQIQLVKWLVDKGAQVQSSEREALGESLLSAAEAGRLDDVKTLLTYDANINAQRAGGITALVLAAENGHVRVGEFLAATAAVKRAGRIPSEDEKLGSMLTNACTQGDLERAEVLLRFGASGNGASGINACQALQCGESPLWRAAINGHSNIADLLIKHRADLEMKGRNCRRTPLIVAIDCGKREVVDLLLARKAEVPEPIFLGHNLCYAAFTGEVDRLRILLRVRADLQSTDAACIGQTALHRAVAGGQLEIVRLLLAKKADVDAKVTTHVQRPERIYLCESHWLIMKQRISAKLFAEPTGKLGPTALSAAAENKNADIVRLLLESGANTRGRDKDGFRKAQEFLKSIATSAS